MTMFNVITTNEPKLLSIGACVPLGNFEATHSRFRSVVNFIRDDRVISLCDGSHTPGPFRVNIEGLVMEDVTTLELSTDLLRINSSLSLPITPRDIYSSPVFAEITNPELLHRNLNQASEYLYEHATPGSIPRMLKNPSPDLHTFEGQYQQSLRTGLELLSLGKYREGALALKRRGLGLTPAGDDLLCGFLIGASWLERTRKKQLSKIRQCIYYASLDNDVMVNTFLFQGYALLMDSDWAEFLLGLCQNERLNYGSMDCLLRHGASSGADQLMGFHQAVELFGIYEEIKDFNDDNSKNHSGQIPGLCQAHADFAQAERASGRGRCRRDHGNGGE